MKQKFRQKCLSLKKILIQRMKKLNNQKMDKVVEKRKKDYQLLQKKDHKQKLTLIRNKISFKKEKIQIKLEPQEAKVKIFQPQQKQIALVKRKQI